MEYYKNGGKKPDTKVKEGTIVCVCFNVTDAEIERAVKENGLKTLVDVTNFTKAGGACGKCREKIQGLINKLTEAV
ncbi:MAG: (2Fe-2S)-binding protein [Chitinispirillales bacterium]|nr:(2Fe-2S)-binding protein [Chitinispirillales bacterium]